MRRWLGILGLCLLAIALPSQWVAPPAQAAGSCAIYKTWSTNGSVSATDLNSLQTTLGQTNMVTSCVDGDSATVGGMQTMVDPYPGGTESLATTLKGELERLRYALQKLSGWSQWYSYTSPITTSTGLTANAGTLTTSSHALAATVTWNESGTGFTMFSLKATDTASAAGSLLADWQVGGASKFKVDKSGNLSLASATNGSYAKGGASGAVTFQATPLPPADTGTWSVGGRLTLSGGNLLWSPYTSNIMPINSALVAIPDAGVTLAPPAVASTTYYIYAYMNSGTMTLEASATAYAVQAGTGVPIKNGDATRTLVGLARTTSGNAWADTLTHRFVLSYWHRRAIHGLNTFTTDRTTTSATYAEINTEIRVEFLAWGDEDVRIADSGSAQNDTSATTVLTALGVDGTTVSASTALTVVTGGYIVPTVVAAPVTLSEGYHYLTLLGKTNGGIAKWFAADGAVTAANRLTVMVRG